MEVPSPAVRDLTMRSDERQETLAQTPLVSEEAEKATSARSVSLAEAAWTPPSWDEVVREHADRVYRLAYRLTGNSHDAEDLTQETFIRVFRSLANYQPGTFEGWLHRITTNLFLDMARRRSRVRMEGLPDDTDRIVGDDPSPEQVYSDTHLDPDLQQALDELPPEFRAAVVLCDVEGLSYEEIGATLGVKLGTVRSRIHRGRQALRASLERQRAAALEPQPESKTQPEAVVVATAASASAVEGKSGRGKTRAEENPFTRAARKLAGPAARPAVGFAG
jgi:RNA polymerase sigma-70 factor (ECF subfamily)